MLSPFYVECYILLCVFCTHISIGMVLALPSIVTPAITSNFTDIHATTNEASWFTASFGMTGPISFLLLPAVLQLYGRRITVILINFIIFTGSVIIASSSNITSLIIGRAIQGFAFAGIVLCCIIVAEYSHPRRRGSFITLKVAGMCFGELLCHGLGLCLSWRCLAWMATVPSALGIISTLNWPESPAWLAYQCRYEDCKKSFEKLRGKSREAKKELTELISAQQELKRTSLDYGTNVKAILKTMRSKEFLKPLLSVILLITLLHASGKFYLIAYLIEIMTKMTGDKRKAYYFAICFDAMKTIALFLSSYVIRLYNRRTILFGCGSIACLLLGLVCVFSYLESIGTLNSQWISPLLMLLYIFMCTSGITAICIVSKGELFPLHYRGIGSCVSGIFLACSASLIFKITHAMIETLQVYGMLSVYLIVCIIMLIILYFVLPETKDETLQQIENNYFNIKLPVDLEERGDEIIKDVKT